VSTASQRARNSTTLYPPGRSPLELSSIESATGRESTVAAVEENKQLVRRFYEEIDKGNLDAMDELIAENYENHDPPPFPDLKPGLEGLKQAFRMFWEGTPGTHTIEDQIAEGDKVVTRLRARGRFDKELAGIPPTGKELDVTATAIHRIEDGKIVEHWSNVDSAALMAQLGLITLPAPP
jgi:steroid delta-isomerase-like uncharacterized protein